LVSGETIGTADITGNIIYVPLNAWFTANITAGPVPLAVKFTDWSTGPPTSWKWDFGDGGNSSDRHPTHTFSTAGIYQVVLNITGETGNFSQFAGTITVIAPLPIPVQGEPIYMNGGDDEGPGISGQSADPYQSCQSGNWAPSAVTIVNGTGLLTNTSINPDLFGIPGAAAWITTMETPTCICLPLAVLAGVVIAVLAIIGTALLFFMRRDQRKG
jgi:PKD repeat protein